MSFDDDADEDAPGFRPPPHPDDRIWRHPSEIAAHRARSGGEQIARRRSPGPRAAAVVAGVLLVVAAGGVTLAALARGDGEGGPTTTAATPSPDAGGEPTLRSRAGDRIAAAVVAVGQDAGQDPGSADVSGSGVVVRPDGLVLTSAALLDELLGSGPGTVDVRLADGTDVKGTVVGRDALTGVAVLDVPGEGLAHVPLAGPGDLGRGQTAVTVAAGGAGEPVATAGVVGVSQRLGDDEEALEGVVEVDGGAGPQVLGGPVVDGGGALVGLTTATDGDEGGSAYVTPAAVAARVADDLVRQGHVRHAWLGMEGYDESEPPPGESLMNDDRTGPGAEVASVEAAGPAATAGLVAGDVIVRVDGRRVERMPDLLLTLRARAPGETVELVVRRQETLVTLVVTLGEVPAR